MCTERQREEREKTDTDDFPHATRNTIIGVALAVFAMVTYALVSGLVTVEVSRDEDEETRGVKDEDTD